MFANVLYIFFFHNIRIVGRASYTDKIYLFCMIYELLNDSIGICSSNLRNAFADLKYDILELCSLYLQTANVNHIFNWNISDRTAQ